MEQVKLLYQKRMDNLFISDYSIWVMAHRICYWDLFMARRKHVTLYFYEGLMGNVVWFVYRCFQS